MEKEIDLDEYNSPRQSTRFKNDRCRKTVLRFFWLGQGSVLDMKRNGVHDGSAYQICRTVYDENFNLALIDRIEAKRRPLAHCNVGRGCSAAFIYTLHMQRRVLVG